MKSVKAVARLKHCYTSSVAACEAWLSAYSYVFRDHFMKVRVVLHIARMCEAQPAVSAAVKTVRLWRSGLPWHKI